jgi:uncharacterized protein YdhG (YjbR/CyaY superfamily)
MARATSKNRSVPFSRPTSFAQYVSRYPKPVRAKLREMRTLIAAAAPGAKLELKWGRPAFSLHRILVVFGGFKAHIGFFPTPSAIREFKQELAGYHVSSATIRFPLDQPLPGALIRRITKFRVAESRSRDAKWRTAL